MYDNKLSTEIHLFAAYLDEHRQTASRSRWPFPTNDYDLVLDIIKMEDDEVIGAYYYVDHVTKTLFWQGHYDCKDSFLCDVRGGPREPGHVSPYFSCLSINTVRITARSKTGGPLRTNGQ
ncbi:hypothetical protein EDB89DRAFT_2024788 [Lactarius sanguifluus]|nr:hypothetical protein EDB89DRAFT_2024788 [Lactarius sanguifluus]